MTNRFQSTIHRTVKRVQHWALLSAIAIVGASNLPVEGLAYADWPEFRGPQQNGVVASRDLPTRWDEQTNVVWYAKTFGLGWSSPVISGDRIYLTTAVQEEESDENAPLSGPHQLGLECFDAKSGTRIFYKTIFEQPSNAPPIHKKNSHASPTPVIHDNRIYLHYGHQGTACTDLDGNILWTNRDHTYPPVHGNGGSPILVDNKLILTCDGGTNPYTLALDARTGKEGWKQPRDGASGQPFSFCTPQLIEVNGIKQVVSPGSDLVQSLDPETGKVLWYLKYKGYSVIPRPLFHRGLIFLSTGYMTPEVLAIDPSGSGDVTNTHLKWKAKGAAPHTPSLIPYEDQIVMISDAGIAASLAVDSGKEVWKKRIGGNYSASPMLVGNQLFLQSEDGTSSVFRLGEKLAEVSKNALPGRIFASYAVIDNDWIIRSEKGIYRIGMR